jgi:hypothetical protein
MSAGGDLPCAGDGGAGERSTSRTYWTGDPFLFDRPGSAPGRLAADRSGLPAAFFFTETIAWI